MWVCLPVSALSTWTLLSPFFPKKGPSALFSGDGSLAASFNFVIRSLVGSRFPDFCCGKNDCVSLDPWSWSCLLLWLVLMSHCAICGGNRVKALSNPVGLTLMCTCDVQSYWIEWTKRSFVSLLSNCPTSSLSTFYLYFKSLFESLYMKPF